MELKELGEQYKNDLDSLKSLIETTKDLRAKAKSERIKYELDRRLKMFEDMYSEMLSSAEYLIYYYD